MNTGNNERVFKMTFASIYPLYIQKLARKGRSQAELDEALCWLTGYDAAGLDLQIKSGASLREFFDHAPRIHPNATLVKGLICGIRVEEIEDPLMQHIRRMDKLVDELAKGRPMDKVLRKPQ